MENKQFTQDELSQIKVLQDKYSAFGSQLVQLKLSRKSAEEFLQSINKQESEIENQILQANEEEKKLAQSLNAKYGAGSLDLESGVFTPKTA
jgi:hypothetical protein